MIPVAYNLRSLAVRRTTSLAAAAGVALVVFVFAAVRMLSDGIRETLGRTGSADVAIVLRKGSGAELESGIETGKVQVVLSRPGVARGVAGRPAGVGEMLVVMLLDKTGTDGFSNVQLRGVPRDVFAFRPTVKIVEGRALQPGSDEVIVGKAIRGRFKGVELGGSFELRKNRPVHVVGVFEDGGSSFESEAWGDVDTVRAAFGREGIVSSVRVRLEAPGRFDAFRDDVEGSRQLGLKVMREVEYYEHQSEGLATFMQVLGTVIAFFFSLGAMIGATITMHASVANRQREIGTLRALGFSRVGILGSFLLESVLLAIGGGAVGAAASMALGLVRFSTMNPTSWSEISFGFHPTPATAAGALIFAGGMGLVGGFFPALRAARMSPVEAMRG